MKASKTYLLLPFEAGVAEGYPFNLEDLEASSYEEKVAFLWIICIQMIHDDMVRREGYCIVVYDDLGRNLGETKRALFDFAGLSWDAQGQDPIRNLKSQDAGQAGYFNIMRPPLASLDKWREQFSGEQIARIVCHSALGRCFSDRATDPSGPTQPAALIS